MPNNHKFFNNSNCEFFPCHKIKNGAADFNCLFCFCPLYHLPDCGGAYETRGGVKDCSACTRAHSPDFYDTVIARLKQAN